MHIARTTLIRCSFEVQFSNFFVRTVCVHHPKHGGLPLVAGWDSGWITRTGASICLVGERGRPRHPQGEADHRDKQPQHGGGAATTTVRYYEVRVRTAL